MSYGFFALISRMKNIQRWALMRNTERENIQEHSHMTAVLAHALAVIRRDVFGVDCDPEKAALFALFHDASEILTGDMPTPVKYHDKELTEAYKRLEEKAAETLTAALPKELQPEYRRVLGADESVEDLVKAADKLSAYIKCIEEKNAGNSEFKSAEKSTKEKLKALNMPEVYYFIENFMPSFSLTLDELKLG